jgi:hypothetical protein
VQKSDAPRKRRTDEVGAVSRNLAADDLGDAAGARGGTDGAAVLGLGNGLSGLLGLARRDDDRVRLGVSADVYGLCIVSFFVNRVIFPFPVENKQCTDLVHGETAVTLAVEVADVACLGRQRAHTRAWPADDPRVRLANKEPSEICSQLQKSRVRW